MIYEKLRLTVDIKRLQEFCANELASLPPQMATEHFGGWSALSSNGSYKDGFTSSTFVYDESIKNMEQVKARIAEGGVRTGLTYNLPTEIHKGYIAELLKQFEELGFYPRRARLMLLKAGGKCGMHMDNPTWLYGVRLHIPVFTNPQCFFETEDEGSAHLPSDGSVYLLKVNRMHRVTNLGPTDRIHFVASVHDTKGVSQHHQYTESHHRAFLEHGGQG